MPIRFTSPSLGGQRQAFLQRGEWELGLGYRHLYADDYFVGDRIDASQAPRGQPQIYDIHSIAASMAYALSDQVSVHLTVPFQTGTNSRVHPDGVRHVTSATGIGDVSVMGRAWLLDPASHRFGNLALGLGVKAPTGDNAVKGDFRLAEGLFAYLYGLYQLTPREKTNVTWTPTSPVLSVHDVYDARLGLAYAVWPRAGISASLGARVDGVPVRDLIGGSEGYRQPGYVLFLDPGASASWGKETVTVSVPVRLHARYEQNVNDLRNGPGPRGNHGDLAAYLVFLGYARRF